MRVSKLIKLVRLQKVPIVGSNVQCRLVRAYLLDRNAARNERHIVGLQ